MKTPDWIIWVMGIAAFSIGLFFGIFFFGMLMHESSHAMVCLLFGLPYSWSLTQVIYIRSPDPLVNILVGLAGGTGQALFSVIFFWYATTFEKRISVKNFWNELFKGRISPILGILLGFELAFLTIAFHGVVNGIWEGLFHQSYVQARGNFVLLGTIILFCGIVSFYIIYRRFLRLKKSNVL